MSKSESRHSLSRSASSLTYSQFELDAQIGTGSFGTVFRAIHKPSHKRCAIKRIDLESSDDDIEEIQREIAILAECNFHHITRYYGCFMHEFELWIVMEYLGGGSCLDLLKHIKPATLSESVIAEILAQVITGIVYLHSNGKIHRDIKAANVLMSRSGEVKIADFGVAAQLSNNLSRRNTFVGTPFWMAPEVINQLDYHFSADIWSLGITAYELAYGKPPWSHLHPMKALFSIPRNDPARLDTKFSTEFQDFVAQCLQMDPAKRVIITQLAKHPFLARRNRQDLVNVLHQQLPDHEQSLSQLSISSSISASSSSSSLTSINDGSRTLESPPSSSTSLVASAESKPSVDSQKTIYSESSNGANLSTNQGTGHGSSNGSAPQPQQSDTEDDWDFDTIKPQPSLEQILQNPPQNAAVPPPIPNPLSRRNPEQPYNTVDTLRENAGTFSQSGSRGLARIFSHTSRKFHEPVLEEISDLLRADPLTVEVENYLMKRIGKQAVQHFGIKSREKQAPFDDVEQILFDKWLEEVQEAHKSAN